MKGYIIKDGKPMLTNIAEPSLKKHHVIVKNKVAGINHIDIRSMSNPDFIRKKHLLGFEGVGIVEQIDTSCVKTFKVGQRVCYATAFGVGAFCEKISIHENFLSIVPDTIPDQYAATVFKALAAHMLLFRTYSLHKGNTLGITSSSGGTASYLTQWAVNNGVKVIGLTSSSQHKAIAMENGCSSAFTYSDAVDFISQAKKLSSTGFGLNAFYDSMGIKAYALGIKSLAPFGLYVNYGSLSGPIKGMSAKHLSTKALFFTVPSTFYSKANVSDLAITIIGIFDEMKKRTLRPNITQYKFAQLQKAFDDMLGGQIPGQKVLIIDK
ncbi:MAG: NADPH2:quinone reductase [Candidatus Deianiraeaceae bacterium]|jgi:NADPH2:quinone reductase